MTDCGHDEIILELKKENKQLQLLINDLVKSNDGLVKSVNELQQKLAYYENPTPRHLKIPYSGESKKMMQGKNEMQTENQIVAAFQDTRVPHKNSSHKNHSITNHLRAPDVTVQTSMQLKLKKESW